MRRALKTRPHLPMGHVEQVQDATLQKHFLHFIRGASDDYGDAAATELARIIERARKEYGGSFGSYVARLIQADAQAQGW